jgi:hypothetical protein
MKLVLFKQPDKGDYKDLVIVISVLVLVELPKYRLRSELQKTSFCASCGVVPIARRRQR